MNTPPPTSHYELEAQKELDKLYLVSARAIALQGGIASAVTAAVAQSIPTLAYNAVIPLMPDRFRAVFYGLWYGGFPLFLLLFYAGYIKNLRLIRTVLPLSYAFSMGPMLISDLYLGQHTHLYTTFFMSIVGIGIYSERGIWCFSAWMVSFITGLTLLTKAVVPLAVPYPEVLMELFGTAFCILLAGVVVGWIRKQVNKAITNATTLRIKETEHLQRETMLRQQAEEGSRAKSAVLASVAHDLRTPLHQVTSCAAMLEHGWYSYHDPVLGQDVPGTPARDDQKDILTRIERGGNNMLHQVNQLIESARLQSERQTVNISEVAGAELLELIEQHRPTVEGKALKYIVNGDSELVVKTDPNRIQSILQNLIDNAVKFTDRGCITVSIAVNDLGLIFTVQDTGVGIEQSHLPRLYDAFYQTEDDHRGIGLGLHIVKSNVDLLGGKIEVKSTAGEGTLFSVSIPAEIVAKPAVTIVTTSVLSPDNLPRQLPAPLLSQ